MSSQYRSALPMPVRLLFGYLAAILAIGLIALFSWQSQRARTLAAERVTHTLQLLEQLESLLSAVKDAETGQRGFLLAGEQTYLEPYNAARASYPGTLASVRSLVSDDSGQQRRLDTIERLIAEKMAELEQTIALARTGNPAAAVAMVRTDRGQASMDRLRTLIGEMSREERALLTQRQLAWRQAVEATELVTWVGSCLLLVLILVAAGMTVREHRAREAQTWLRAGQADFSSRILGELRLERLGEIVLGFLVRYLDAQVGAVYIAEEDGSFRRFAGHAIAAGAEAYPLRPGDGLLGQVVKDNRARHVTDVPDGYLSIVSATGRGKPNALLLAPATADGVVHAVIELGFTHPVDEIERELLTRISEALGVAVRSSMDRTRLEALLEETQRQGEELQTQQEELRVNNEELLEQSKVLQDSQSRLEAQHAELEQSNFQLAEQANLLEHQKDNLSRAQVVISEKAAELERANQYKSEFLANMSHELRTPLNSSLILAKLLSDNKTGNLTDEQVKFAQIISSAGRDLLAIINDVLDLSKIEAGKIDVLAEQVSLERTVESLSRSFATLAQQKGIGFSTAIEPGLPEHIETDAGRLGQILKNLLSNACKFTERGTVSLRVFSGTEGSVSFSVRDTGIGIPPQQQDVIFEAFRQADGSTHRKYGGTGLGLSISRDLARLLGGEIAVQSTPGEGSTFTLTLPARYAAPTAAPRAVPSPAPATTATSAAAPAAVTAPRALAPTVAGRERDAAAVADDRERLEPGSRTILVVEDDKRFASILCDLVREMGFHCVVTHSANEGLAAAVGYRPSAILLDVNLPDHSGLGVLDQLKRNAATRHIPVHVLSVEDYTHEALELGAVGYALKPVKREDLVDALQKLEAKFSQGLRHVLVVEDDETQRESICQLLANEDVRIVAVASGGEALAQLAAATFDCMVIDLKLPDLSGYELLEKMAAQEDVAFPPVIVYTGRSLSRDEEQRLRRFSRSIIIKDARSPERLLDEVTLFLHQVESKLPPERQRMLKRARDREATLEGRSILVVEDDVRNIFALSSLLEPHGAKIQIARNGREALDVLERSVTRSATEPGTPVDLVLMDIMMPEMDGLTAMREIRKRPEFKKLPIIALTAKAMRDDQEKCLAAGANDYIAKPLDVEKLLSLVRVWMPK
jgi:CheY-like chemotaxis protein/CHASE3 domain sensor protein